MTQGITPISRTRALTRTEAVSKLPMVGKKTKAEEQDELNVQREALQNQLLTLKSSSDAASADAVQAVEAKLQELDQASGVQGAPTALDRLKGQTDRYEAGDKDPGIAALMEEEPSEEEESTATINTDAVDREIRELKEQVEELKRQSASETDPVRAEEIAREQKAVQAELQQKDNETYRKQHAEQSQTPAVMG